MVTIEEAGVLLDEIALEIPKEFYNHLNGGIILYPESKMHPESMGDNLYIMGLYVRDRGLGRCIKIFYGSIQNVYGDIDLEQMKKRLKDILLHEFTHHLESLAGEKGLEIDDEIQMERYKRRQEQLNKRRNKSV